MSKGPCFTASCTNIFRFFGREVATNCNLEKFAVNPLSTSPLPKSLKTFIVSDNDRGDITSCGRSQQNSAKIQPEMQIAYNLTYLAGWKMAQANHVSIHRK